MESDAWQGNLISSVATAILFGLGILIVRVMKQKHSQNLETHGGTVEEYRKLIARQDERITAQDGKIAKLEAETRKCHEEKARQDERIGWLEAACKESGISVAGSREHRALPKEGTP
jgi:predicted RNase H-like nuclease (RuvC/YqgF family)